MHTWTPHASASGRETPQPSGYGRHGLVGHPWAFGPARVGWRCASFCHSRRLQVVYYCCPWSGPGELQRLQDFPLLR